MHTYAHMFVCPHTFEICMYTWTHSQTHTGEILESRIDLTELESGILNRFGTFYFLICKIKKIKCSVHRVLVRTKKDCTLNLLHIAQGTVNAQPTGNPCFHHCGFILLRRPSLPLGCGEVTFKVSAWPLIGPCLLSGSES